MLCLITFSFSKLIETYRNPACHLAFVNLPSLKLDLATWKYLLSELKYSCESPASVN